MMNGASWQDAPELMKLGLTFFTLGAVIISTALWHVGWRVPAALIFAAALVFVATKAMAHDASRPDLAPWFDQLRSPYGGLCCSLNDGIFDPDWRSNDGHYEVKIDGEWRIVRDDVVITEPNRIGRTMVWVHRGMWGIAIRCFMPGAGM